MLGQWDILLLNLTSFANQILMWEQSKMTHLKKNRETNAGPIDFHWFHDFFRCLIFEFFFFTNANHLNKIHETNAGKIKEQDVTLT